MCLLCRFSEFALSTASHVRYVKNDLKAAVALTKIARNMKVHEAKPPNALTDTRCTEQMMLKRQGKKEGSDHGRSAFQHMHLLSKISKLF